MIGIDYQAKIREATKQTPVNLIPVVEKEILHYEILKFLNDNHFLDEVVFMGGTSLRLCYGGVRYSEDLDFVVRKNFDIESMRELGLKMKHHFESVVGVNVHINEPKSLKTGERNDEGIVVDKWHFSFETNSQRRDLPKQKIKMEIADVPAHSIVLRQVCNNYKTFLSVQEELNISVESLDEILADKIVAFNATGPNRIRYRDIWDIQWLLAQGAVLNFEYVFNKIEDYKIENMDNKMSIRITELKDIIYGDKFTSELQRFLEPSVWQNTIDNVEFKGQCYQTLKQLFETVLDSLTPPDDDYKPY